MIEGYEFSFDWKQWYMEYQQRGSGIRLHFYVSIMINNWPILVWCKFDNPESSLDWNQHVAQLLFIKLCFITSYSKDNIIDVIENSKYEA